MGAVFADLFVDVSIATSEFRPFPRKSLRHDVKVPEGEFFPRVRDRGWQVEVHD